MSHVWKKVQDEMLDEKTFTKKALTLFGFSNRARRFTGSNYLNVDSPFQA